MNFLIFRKRAFVRNLRESYKYLWIDLKCVSIGWFCWVLYGESLKSDCFLKEYIANILNMCTLFYYVDISSNCPYIGKC